jgi:hypothetical protein
MQKGEKMGKSKTVFLLMLLTLALSFTGCVDAKFHIFINHDGSGDLVYRMLMDPTVLSLTGQYSGGDPLKTMVEEAQKTGFTTVPVTDSGKKGFEARKHITDIAAAVKKGDLFGKASPDTSFKPGQGLKIKKGFLKTVFILNSDLDMSKMGNGLSGETDEQKMMAQTMLRSMKFDFALTLPVKAKSSNASKVEDNGKTLVWNLIPGEHNQVTMEAEAWNVTNLILLIVVGLAVMVGLIFFLIKRRPGATEAGENVLSSGE